MANLSLLRKSPGARLSGHRPILRLPSNMYRGISLINDRLRLRSERGLSISSHHESLLVISLAIPRTLWYTIRATQAGRAIAMGFSPAPPEKNHQY